MKHTIEGLLHQAIIALKKAELIDNSLTVEVKVERAKDKLHGDFATNIALTLAKPCQCSPRTMAAQLIHYLPSHVSIEKVEIAGPGFINFFIKEDALSQVIGDVLTQGVDFGRSEWGQGQKVLVEFVSANPTGPLHVGHGRGAAFGATLANLLSLAGFNVTREYYVNDAGRQMNILAASVWLRYLTCCGVEIVFPANGYKGDYVLNIANQIFDLDGNKYQYDWSQVVDNLPKDEPAGGDKEIYIDAVIDKSIALLGQEGFNRFHQQALNSVLDDIKLDLSAFGVDFDHWFSERSLLDGGSIDKGIEALKKGEFTYENEGALWFRATDFGDEKDRVLVRANGQTTYFASDVAYHWNKYDRGFDRVIDIFGADHHGYISRIRAAVRALSHDDSALDVLLVQFAILYRNGERVQMSTRSGSFVTLRELREEVGNDAARFFYVMRKPEQHMDFDLDLAKSDSNDNPVYYIQYAHARICSVLFQLSTRGLVTDDKQGLANVALLNAKEEQVLIDLLNRYPELIENASKACEPHQISYYLRELANGLHSYYNAIILLCESTELRAARMCLLKAVRQVLNNGLVLMGVSAPESM